VLAPLTQLTALQAEIGDYDDDEDEMPAHTRPPLPAVLAHFTGLRRLSATLGFRPPSAVQLRSLLSPLTQLTTLKLAALSGGSCRLPALPRLQCLEVRGGVAAGGLARIAAACTALTSLRVHDCITTGTADAAARLPALRSLEVFGSEDCDLAISPRDFSLAACCPGLTSLVVHENPSAQRLKGLTQLRSLKVVGPLHVDTAQWSALAALPALQAFDTYFASMPWGSDPMHACVSFLCAQLTELRLFFPVQASQYDRCAEWAAAMRRSRVQVFEFGVPHVNAAWQPSPPELPTPFFEQLASWSCLTSVEVRFGCTGEQLSVLCASPTIVRVALRQSRLPHQLNERGEAADGAVVTNYVQQLMDTHRAKDLEIYVT